jgi:hypothetical protein
MCKFKYHFYLLFDSIDATLLFLLIVNFRQSRSAFGAIAPKYTAIRPSQNEALTTLLKVLRM